VELLSGAFVVLFALVFLWWGWEFTEFAIYRISELAELPLWTIHMAWPIAGAVWLLFQPSAWRTRSWSCAAARPAA
jgi:TRAP-type C4-dicarboxylate transport system permease small subunit